MHRRSWLTLALLALGASLFVAAGFASSADAAKKGGTLRINIPGTDVDHIDPQLAYGTTTWAMEYSTALKLYDYPDAKAPKGTRLVPTGATRYKVSRNGRVYTFYIRKGQRFSDGSKVTARSFAYAINRSLDRSLQSPAYQFISDENGTNIVGAADVREGRAGFAKGVKAKGMVLTITLTKADPTFMAKISMPFFQATSTRIARGSEIINVSGNQLPSAGPYYVSFREPNRLVTLKRNPYYKGSRPRNATQINFKMQVNLDASFSEVKAGQSDYSEGLPATAAQELARDFKINKSRFWVTPSACVSYLALNNNSALFKNNPALRKAVNFAINRKAMVQLAGFAAGQPTDQILPPVLPGYKNANIYPATPNLTKARALARGHLRNVEAPYFHGLSGVGPARMELVRANLKQLGIDITPKGFRGFAIYDAAGQRNSNHAFATVGWCKDYPDPYDFVNILLYGGNIQAENNNNLAYFNTPSYNKKMEKAARLVGDARLRAYGNLDIDIQKNQAPWASWNVPTNHFFFGPRVDTKTFVYQPIYETPSYGALALK